MGKQVSLNGVVTASIANEILKDKETRDDIRQGAKEVVKGGISVVKGFFMVLGISAGVGLLYWGGKKIYNTIQENKKESERESRLKEQKADAESKLKHEAAWFDNAVEQLKTAMQTKEGFNAWVSYDEERITKILSSLSNKYEWIYLLDEFGKIDGHNLLDWIGCDGSSDIADYNKILDNLNVDEIYKISNVGLWGVEENVLTI